MVEGHYGGAECADKVPVVEGGQKGALRQRQSSSNMAACVVSPSEREEDTFAFDIDKDKREGNDGALCLFPQDVGQDVFGNPLDEFDVWGIHSPSNNEEEAVMESKPSKVSDAKRSATTGSSSRGESVTSTPHVRKRRSKSRTSRPRRTTTSTGTGGGSTEPPQSFFQLPEATRSALEAEATAPVVTGESRRPRSRSVGRRLGTVSTRKRATSKDSVTLGSTTQNEAKAPDSTLSPLIQSPITPTDETLLKTSNASVQDKNQDLAKIDPRKQPTKTSKPLGDTTFSNRKYKENTKRELAEKKTPPPSSFTSKTCCAGKGLKASSKEKRVKKLPSSSQEKTSTNVKKKKSSSEGIFNTSEVVPKTQEKPATKSSSTERGTKRNPSLAAKLERGSRKANNSSIGDGLSRNSDDGSISITEAIKNSVGSTNMPSVPTAANVKMMARSGSKRSNRSISAPLIMVPREPSVNNVLATHNHKNMLPSSMVGARPPSSPSDSSGTPLTLASKSSSILHTDSHPDTQRDRIGDLMQQFRTEHALNSSRHSAHIRSSSSPNARKRTTASSTHTRVTLPENFKHINPLSPPEKLSTSATAALRKSMTLAASHAAPLPAARPIRGGGGRRIQRAKAVEAAAAGKKDRRDSVRDSLHRYLCESSPSSGSSPVHRELRSIQSEPLAEAKEKVRPSRRREGTSTSTSAAGLERHLRSSSSRKSAGSDDDTERRSVASAPVSRKKERSSSRVRRKSRPRPRPSE